MIVVSVLLSCPSDRYKRGKVIPLRGSHWISKENDRHSLSWIFMTYLKAFLYRFVQI